MPLYEYVCDEHGVFDDWKDFSRSSEGSACPECGALGARILSVPHRSSLAPSEVKARDRNERSRHEPRTVTRAASAPAAESKARTYTGPRPWVVEHG